MLEILQGTTEEGGARSKEAVMISTGQEEEVGLGLTPFFLLLVVLPNLY